MSTTTGDRTSAKGTDGHAEQAPVLDEEKLVQRAAETGDVRFLIVMSRLGRR